MNIHSFLFNSIKRDKKNIFLNILQIIYIEIYCIVRLLSSILLKYHVLSLLQTIKNVTRSRKCA